MDVSEEGRIKIKINPYSRDLQPLLNYLHNCPKLLTYPGYPQTHSEPTVPVSEITRQKFLPLIEIKDRIDSIDDLIKIGEKYRAFSTTHRFGFDFLALLRLLPSLKKLKRMIGLETVKNQIVDQIISSLQHLYEPEHRFHTVIQGPPGVGKTMLAKILGEIYLQLGLLKNENKDKSKDKNNLKFQIARRSDLIGRYLGHTAKKTQDFIDRCQGGVLFIDEVYSLGNPQQRDSFAKECIDTLNLNLSEKNNFICIVAGYPEEIESSFFAYNAGLRRRFSFTYSIRKYSPSQLAQIFIDKVKQKSWCSSPEFEEELGRLMEREYPQFPHFGGDLETLLLNCKTSHGRRIFGLSPIHRKILTSTDLRNGFENYLATKKQNEDDKLSYRQMYL